MDPNAALLNAMNDMFEAQNKALSIVRRDEHKVAAAYALRDLADWLEKGGFPPTVTLVQTREDTSFYGVKS